MMRPKKTRSSVRIVGGIVAVVAFSSGLSWPLFGNAETQTVKPRAVLTIDTDTPSKPSSPMIFGGFLEHFDHEATD